MPDEPLYPEPPEADFEDTDEEPYDSARRTWTLRIIAIAAILGLLLLFVLRPGPGAVDARGPAPSFALPYLMQEGTLSSDELRGRPVVLNFWASWCAPCREEMPLLEQVWQRYRGRGLIVVGVDLKDVPSDAEAFVRDGGFTYPMVSDLDQQLGRALDVHGLPQTFFIDHNYEFHASTPGGDQGTRVLGAISEEELVREIEAMLEEAGI
jgi:thiol-disulfide isomerase/thioredoxin